MFASKSLVHPKKNPFRNLIMLFFTIVFWFGSVMVLADLNIQTNINNARQTIQRITITSDGTDGWNILLDINTGGKIFINTAALNVQSSFSGNILGLDANGQMIYVPSNGLIVSWGNNGNGNGNGNGDSYWTGDVSNIRNTNKDNVGVWGAPATGKLYVRSNALTELALQEFNPSNAANIHLINTINTRMVWGFSDRFYIGNNNSSFINITTGGYVGIWTTSPEAPLQVVGNVIAGDYGNTTNGTYTFIGWGNSNTISSTPRDSAIVGWAGNTISSAFSFIAGWQWNSIIWSSNNSMAVGQQVLIADKPNTFVRNSSGSLFSPDNSNAFFINTPLCGTNCGGVWINVTDPQVEVDIDGRLRLRPRIVHDTKSDPCTAALEGTIYYNGATKLFYGCNGTTWNPLNQVGP